MMRACYLLWLSALFCPLLQAAPAERIIALSPHAVELLFAIGAGDRIVATTDYADYPDAALKIPRIGGYQGIQLDRALALKADLVVAWRGGNRPDDLHQLERLGFNLYYSEPQTLDQIADEMEQLGRLTGQQQQAASVAAAYRQQLAQLRQQYSNKPPVRVFYQLWPSPLMSVSRNSWIHQTLSLCSGDNVMADAATDYPQLTIEQVLVAQPEVILTATEHSDASTTPLDWQRWPEIPAVKNQHVYPVSGDWLHRFGPRVLLGIRSVCEALDSAR